MEKVWLLEGEHGEADVFASFPDACVWLHQQFGPMVWTMNEDRVYSGVNQKEGFLVKLREVNNRIS